MDLSRFWKFGCKSNAFDIYSPSHLIPTVKETSEKPPFAILFPAVFLMGIASVRSDQTRITTQELTQSISVAVRVFLGLAADSPLSAITCRAFTGYITFASLSLMFGVEIVEILRGERGRYLDPVELFANPSPWIVRALYRDNTVLRYGLPLLYLAQVAIMVSMASLLLHNTSFSNDQCSILDSPLASLKLM